MSREEILFRGKRTDNGEWVEGSLLIDYISGQYFIHTNGNSVNESNKIGEEGCLKFFAFEVDPETVCQYADIRTFPDYKNGRKIFEGDIIKVNDFWTGVVVWEFNDTSFEVEPNDEMETMESLGVVVNGNKVEVIGNIFDNPELLEGGDSKCD